MSSPSLLKAAHFAKVIDLPMIGDREPTFREVVQIAKRINRDDQSLTS